MTYHGGRGIPCDLKLASSSSDTIEITHFRRGKVPTNWTGRAYMNESKTNVKEEGIIKHKKAHTSTLVVRTMQKVGTSIVEA